MAADVRKVVEIALQIVGIDMKKVSSLVSVFEDVQKQIDKSTQSINNIQKALSSIKAPKSLTEVVTQLKQLDKIKVPNLVNIANGFTKLGKLQKPPDLSKFVTELQKFANIKLPGITTLINGFKKLISLDVNAVINKIRALNTALRELDKRGGISAFKNFARDVNTLKSSFNAAASATTKIKNSLKSVGDVADRTGIRLRTFGDKVRTVLEFRLISEALLQVKAAVAAGVDAIIQYDQALKDLQAITGATSLEVSQMGIKILEVASRTKFSAQEIAEGMRIIGQAGFSASDAIETMQAVSDLATGTLSSMNTTVDLVTTAMRVFQIEATQSAMVADVFANAVNRSKLTIDKLRTSMNYIGPIARDSGVTFKELAASMMTLANSGLRASTIGTGLRRVFAELIDPSKKLKAAAEAAGVSLNELDPRATSLTEVISNLGLVVKDAQVAFDVFGKRGAAAVLALSGAGSKFNELLDVVDRSGIAAKQAAIQMEGLGVSLKNLQDKLGILAIALGKLGIADAMRIIINISRYLVDALTYLIDNTFARFVGKVLTTSIAVFALVKAFTALRVLIATKFIAPLIAQMVALATATTGATVAAGGLTAAFLPLVIIIGTITAIGYAMYAMFEDKSAIAAEEAAKLADQYDILEKKLRDYGEATVSMAKDSDELKSSTIALRTHLIDVSNSTSELADEALAAAESINPLNGTFRDGKEALDEYNESLNEFQTDQLMEALREASESFDHLISKMNIWRNAFIDGLKQVGSTTKSFVKSIAEMFANLSFDAGAKSWGEAWNKEKKKAKEIQKAIDLSKALKKNEASLEDLKASIATYDRSNLTAQQEDLIKAYDFLNERAKKYVQHLRDTGKISLRDTIANIRKMSEDAGQVGTNLEAVVLEFARLKKANEDTFTNIVEKWEKQADPKFLTNLVDGFNELGGAISRTDRASLSQIENQRQLRIQQLNDLKATIAVAKESGVDMEKFWAEYYTKEQDLLKKANEDRKVLSKNRQAQNIIAYSQELETLEKHLAKIRETYKYNDEERGKQLAQARAESAKRLQDLMSGITVADPKAQTEAYKTALKQREASHAAFITSVNELEAMRGITEETAERRRLDATLNFYAQSLAKAKTYRDQVSKITDPKEYAKRHRIVLTAEKRFYQQRSKYLIAYADLKEEMETTKAEASSKVAEALYDKALKKQKDAQKTLNAELKSAYDTDVLNIKQYYAKKKDLAIQSEKEKADLVSKRMDIVSDEYDTQIEQATSLTEKEKLKGEQLEALIKLQSQLDSIEQSRIQTVEKLNAEEYKATEAAKKRANAIIEQIKRKQEAAEVAVPGTTFEKRFQIEMDALRRYHAEKYAALEKETNDEVSLAEAKALQLKEIEDRITAHEREAFYIRLKNQAQFAGDMASIAKDLVESGIIQSKEAFKVYQAFAIAETMISTYSAAQKAYETAMESGSGTFAMIRAATAYAAAVVKGIATVAQIRKQQPSGYADGGKIKGSSPHPKADNVSIWATAGEFMQPVAAVRKYGIKTMNAIRNLSIPKVALTNLIAGTTKGLKNPVPSFALAGGGPIPNIQNGAVKMSDKFQGDISIVMDNTFTGVDETVAKRIGSDFEDRVTKILYKVMR